MPVGALASIAHRISGILLALGVPVCVYLFDLSLRSPATYERMLSLIGRWPFKLAAVGFIWALAHHVLAGTRHLLSDIDIGSRLRTARRSAWAVNLGGVAVALLGAGALFR